MVLRAQGMDPGGGSDVGGHGIIGLKKNNFPGDVKIVLGGFVETGCFGYYGPHKKQTQYQLRKNKLMANFRLVYKLAGLAHIQLLAGLM